MSNLVDEKFGTSVNEAVQATANQNKPLFVLLTKGVEDKESQEFENKYVNESTIKLLVSNFVLLKLIEGSKEFGYFSQIFSNLVIPSFYIVEKGKLLDVIISDVEVSDFELRIDKIINSRSNSRPSSSPQFEQESSPSVVQQPSEDVPEQPQPQSQPQSQPQPEIPIVEESHSVSSGLDPKREQSLKEHKRKVALAKKQQNEERKRLRALLRADQKEREIKRVAEQAQYKEQSPSSSTSQTESNKAPQHNQNACALSIKLFDGTSIRHEFEVTQTLNDVRNWLDKELEIIPPSNSMPSFATSSYPQPTNYVFHRPILPRITYTDEQEFLSLLELQLCPRSALILKPVYEDKYSKAYSDSGSQVGVLSRLGGTIGKVGHALYSFFDYGVDNQHEMQHDEDQEHESPGARLSSGYSAIENEDYPPRSNIFSIDNTRTSSASLINFHDPTNVSLPESNNPSNFTSRASSPNPLGSVHSMSRVQTIHDEDRDKKDDTYNGNSVNLTGNEDDKK
ncbi:uncharacterized protein RJT21DRAFT_112582 [Scheffersomyces amazonensis]|uniref:uncharacterized protein n=1 Tax=Scheffersomyces amazonensis TaxID=1078765 RepID=UPI00315D0E98